MQERTRPSAGILLRTPKAVGSGSTVTWTMDRGTAERQTSPLLKGTLLSSGSGKKALPPRKHLASKMRTNNHRLANQSTARSLTQVKKQSHLLEALEAAAESPFDHVFPGSLTVAPSFAPEKAATNLQRSDRSKVESRSVAASQTDVAAVGSRLPTVVHGCHDNPHKSAISSTSHSTTVTLPLSVIRNQTPDPAVGQIIRPSMKDARLLF